MMTGFYAEYAVYVFFFFQYTCISKNQLLDQCQPCSLIIVIWMMFSHIYPSIRCTFNGSVETILNTMIQPTSVKSSKSLQSKTYPSGVDCSNLKKLLKKSLIYPNTKSNPAMYSKNPAKYSEICVDRKIIIGVIKYRDGLQVGDIWF